MSPATRRFSGPARTLDVIRLTCSKAAVWTVDDVARLILISSSSLFSHIKTYT